MPPIKISDGGGGTLSLFEIDGRYYPRFPEDALRGVKSLKIRQDDVIVCAYPKSGTHWIWEMVRFLLAGNTTLEVVEKDDGFIEIFPQDFFDALPSPRALNTHYWFDKLPTEVLEKKPKIVFLLRNPKDVAVSYFHHHTSLFDYYQYSGSWQNYLPLMLEGKVDYNSWFDYVLQWEKAIKDHPELPIHIIYYEDYKEDVLREVKKLSQFLGKDYNETFLKNVCEACRFQTMRKSKGHLELNEKGNPVMYRKGEVGDWKNWFTVAQSEYFDHIYKEKMKNSNLKLRFTL
ncbi:sulfotransferase family cytosolic 1B member 1-like [Gigantopelta aegis]|uniref:sulfotransferase family cytosolic 1B member 1-like n=1 Tax=Gigantopelta aegis TaxID=1735272 RepID=UPI001B88CB77|nr:sulfotransferase family cytosolic 1B member 1-like [Gigantopelta aegis]